MQLSFRELPIIVYYLNILKNINIKLTMLLLSAIKVIKLIINPNYDSKNGTKMFLIPTIFSDKL